MDITDQQKSPSIAVATLRRPLVASAALIAKKRPRTGASKELESPRLQDGATSRGYHSSF